MFSRLTSLKKPDVVVQVVVLAEDERIQNMLEQVSMLTVEKCNENMHKHLK